MGGHGGITVAPDRIRFAAQAAFGCGLLDKILRRHDATHRRQRVVLAAKMRLRLPCVVPAAITIEHTAGSLDESEQIVYLGLRNCRRRRMRERPITQGAGDARNDCRSAVHSSLPSGNSDKSLTFSLCQVLRAGSLVYSTSWPFSSVRQTRRDAVPGARTGLNAS